MTADAGLFVGAGLGLAIAALLVAAGGAAVLATRRRWTSARWERLVIAVFILSSSGAMLSIAGGLLP